MVEIVWSPYETPLCANTTSLTRVYCIEYCKLSVKYAQATNIKIKLELRTI